MNVKAKRRAGFENLRNLIRGLQALGAGTVLEAAIERSAAYVRGRVKGELRRHVKTGLALRTASVQTSKSDLAVTLQHYRRFIRWSFSKGFPLSALKRIQAIFNEEHEKALKGQVP